jgi:putative phosphoribosyl transferase
VTVTVREEAVEVVAHGVRLEGSLAVPEGAAGVVAFAHGSAGNRLGARNRHVAGALRAAGLATLLFDLLTAKEEELDRDTAHLRFNIDLLSHRLVGAMHWLLVDPRTRGLPVGVLGAGTGAASALTAAAREPDRVSAVVSRGGRPDLAGIDLARVHAPTLLIAGGADPEVLAASREALRALNAASECRLEIVAGAGHLFEEAGALERVAELASSWLARHLAAADRPPPHENGDPL